MRKDHLEEDDGLEPLEDKTEALKKRSKRTERAQRRQKVRAEKALEKGRGLSGLLGLPAELLLDIFAYLRPSDILRLAQVNQDLHAFIASEEPRLARHVIDYRYACLERCFRLPVLLDDVDPALHPVLRNPKRMEGMSIHTRPYQHVQPPDPSVICTCLTCMLRWNALCLVADFAHWQDNLDKGAGLPMIRRGERPAWNQKLVAAHAALVNRALRRPLWHARLLEAHLLSTTRAISRHRQNKGNKRRRFTMEDGDVASGTDLFLERSGPPTLDFPFHRDNYFMLEAYLPNRGWSSEKQQWMYMPASQHETDLQFVLRSAERERERQRALEEESATSGHACLLSP